MSDLRQATQQALEAWQTATYGHPSHHKAMLLAMTALRAALAEPDVPETDFGNMAAAVAEPVASVTECEACFTPDVCQLRGTCDHYAAERLRVAAPPQREPLTPDQVWANEEIMKSNADAGLLMVTVMRFVRAIERAHGIAPASAQKEQA